MLAAVTLAGQAAGGLTGIASRLGGLLSGGAARDKARDARKELHLQGALAGDVDSARRILWGRTNTASADRKRFDDAWARVLSAKPDVAQQALAAGPLSVGFGDADSKGWAAEFDSLRNGLAEKLANTVQRVGTALTNTATAAVAPNGSDLNQPVSIPTTRNTLLWVTLGVVVVGVVLWKRGG